MAGNKAPKILKSTPLAQGTNTANRVGILAASMATPISPTTVYLPGGTVSVSVGGLDADAAGTWTCPPGLTSVQVECKAAGGGGGGGLTTAGGGGGGGGEYACEDNYPVIPGQSYAYSVGRPGQGGITGAGAEGSSGGNTVFDPQGNGLSGGVVANGGLGGDGPSRQNAGTGSSNSAHHDGGIGGAAVSGVSSDDPTSVPSLALWWRLDDNGAGGGSLLSTVADSSGNSRNGATGAVSALDSYAQGNAPIQVPTRTTALTTQGNCALLIPSPSTNLQIISAPSFGLGSGAAMYNGSALTVSAWIKGYAGFTSWGIGARSGISYAAIASNCDFPGSGATSFGFALYLANGVPTFRLAGSGVTGVATAGSALAYNSTTWHQVTGTWDGTTMTLYVDGVSAATATPSFSGGKFPQGTTVVRAGVNAYTRADSGFNGYLSNLYIAGSAVSSSYVSNAVGGGSSASGGSGGGASGGSAGTGFTGASATSSAGAAGGVSAGGTALHLGSGAGGAGGGIGVNGVNALASSPFGGGGGGAGEGAVVATITPLSVMAAHSASYCGADALGGNNGKLYDISDSPQAGLPPQYPSASLLSPTMYSGGTPASTFNGSMNAVALLGNVAPQLSALSVNQATLSVTVQSPAATVLPLWYCNPPALSGNPAPVLPASLGSNADVAMYLGTVTALASVSIPAGPAGRRVSFDITDTGFITALTTGQVALILGGMQGISGGFTDGSYSGGDSYAWNTLVNGANSLNPGDNLAVELECWSAAGSANTGGDGSPGMLVITYPNLTATPVTSVQPATTTDDSGNTHAAGVTSVSVVAYQPGVVPAVPETWHSLGTLTLTGFTLSRARYRYAPDDGGTLVIQVAGVASSASAAASFSVVLPSAYRPTSGISGASDLIAVPATLTGSGSATLQMAGSTNPTSPGTVSLFLSSANGTVHTIARIPLT